MNVIDEHPTPAQAQNRVHPMKLCLVSQEYPPETGGGGIGTKTYIEAHGMAQRGHEVHVVAASTDNEPRETMDGAVHVHRVGLPTLPTPGFETTTYWLAYSQAVAHTLCRLHERYRFDLIQFAEYAGEGFVFQTDTFAYRDCPYLVQLHGPLSMFVQHMGWPESGSTMHRVGAFMEKTVMEHADRVLACSRNTARFAAETYGLDLDRIQVVHSAVDTERFNCPPIDDAADGPRILFVGKVATNKGFDHLVHAMIQTKDRLPGTRMRVIGRGDASHIAAVMSKTEDAGIRDRIDLLGYVPHVDLPGHFRWCTVFAGPSLYEPGPGHVYIEAMACRRPVIACDSGGTPEVVRHGETGLLVPPGDVDALADALTQIASRPDWVRSMTERGRDWAVDHFSLDVYCAKIEQIYQEIVFKSV